MAQEPDELRQQIDEHRAEISGTVTEIENRVRPSRIAARRTDAVKQRMSGWKDAVFGGSDDGWDRQGAVGTQDSLADRASGIASDAADTIRHGPELARRQTRGNPLAAGAVALGAGWLVAGLMPESRQERKLVARAEPKLAEAVATAKSEGESLVSELKEPAKEAAEQMQHSAKDAASEVAHHAKEPS